MVPLSEYATVDEDATLADAIDALENAQAEFDQSRYRHRAVIVCEKGNKKVLGKISQMDIIRSLEPKYGHMGDSNAVSRFGFSPRFMQSILDQHRLWNEPMRDLCRHIAKVKAVDVMYKLTEGEYVNEKSTLREAVHQLIMGQHQALLVSREEEIVGVLRLTDVFMEICSARKACQL
ncbi:MAG: CBS domain-containing protein [Desulfamplus sp.]|nr:CBS domain-containing protein [Desulfamplus sp.]